MAKKQITSVLQVYMEPKMKQSLDELFGKHGLIPMKTSQFIRDAAQDWMSQLEKALSHLEQKFEKTVGTLTLVSYLTDRKHFKPEIAEYAVQIFMAQRK